ncbi:MAG: DUF2284 domain-containing protein [Thermosulfidibacteraceae bacterium]|jgi:predicted metal-binding protein
MENNRELEILKEVESKLIALGSPLTKTATTSAFVVGEWVRLKCEYGCPDYGKSKTCPPYTPDANRMRVILREFKYAIFFTGYSHEDVRRIGLEALKYCYDIGVFKVFPLLSGRCRLCKECTPEKCTYPHLAYPSLEACSIDVFQTAKNINIELKYGDTYLHIGAILIF